MKHSKNHTGRKAFNWLIYDIIDKFLDKYSKYIKGNLVDLGCGEAPYKEYFLNFASSYVGVDWENSTNKDDIDIFSNLNEKVNLENKVADTIVSISVIEHLCEPQIFLNEAYRILKNDGVMLLQVPWQWKIHSAPYDYFRYTPHGLKYMFEKAGFKDIKIEAQNGFFTTVSIKINYFSVKLIRGPRFIRLLIKLFLIPFWTIGQILAPYFDKLDRNWFAETSGYFVVAKK